MLLFAKFADTVRCSLPIHMTNFMPYHFMPASSNGAVTVGGQFLYLIQAMPFRVHDARVISVLTKPCPTWGRNRAASMRREPAKSSSVTRAFAKDPFSYSIPGNNSKHFRLPLICSVNLGYKGSAELVETNVTRFNGSFA